MNWNLIGAGTARIFRSSSFREDFSDWQGMKKNQWFYR